MSHKRKKKLSKAAIAKMYPKSELVASCHGKTIYPSEAEGEKGATLVWSRDPSANREDLHAYECPDGCKFGDSAGWHVGHRSFYEVFLQRRQEIVDSVET